MDAARALHERLICLDTHLDTPANFLRPDYDIMRRQSVDQFSWVDYPRMVEGGLDGGFFAIYTGQGPLTPEGYQAARDAAFLRAVQIREMVAAHSDKFELAFTAADAARIAAKGKRIVYQSIENSYPVGEDVTLLRTFHALGVRIAGPVHFGNNQLGDSANDPKGKKWNGLSPLGKAFVAEANAVGVVLDGSHASDDVFDQMLALSTTPIVLTHSSCRALCNVPRNLDDERIVKLANKGGVIQMNAVSQYVIDVPDNADRTKAEGAIYARLALVRTQDAAQVTKIVAQASKDLKALNTIYPQPRATFDDYMKHVLHALKLVGPEHVGFGADWDGGGGITGMEDIAALPKITARLLQEGYSEAAIGQMWSGNVLRVLAKAEAARTSSD